MTRFAGNSLGSYAKASQHDVLYDPRNPKTASLTTFGQFWLGPITLLVMGIVFTGLGGAVFWSMRDLEK